MADHKPRKFKTANIKTAKFKGCLYAIFEPELALLVGLQVVNSKEGGRREEEGALSDKFFGSLSQKIR